MTELRGEHNQNNAIDGANGILYWGAREAGDGYGDGMSLYQAYFAISGLDPFGLSEILITICRESDKCTTCTKGKITVTGGSGAGPSGVTLEQPKGKRDLGNGNKDYPIPAGTYPGHVKTGSSKNGNERQRPIVDCLATIRMAH